MGMRAAARLAGWAVGPGGGAIHPVAGICGSGEVHSRNSDAN